MEELELEQGREQELEELGHHTFQDQIHGD
jgi:hypothetical protein